MTGQNREENARVEMRRAEQTLPAAEALLSLGMWNDAVSRAYYVAFHAACALLVRLGQQARTHRGVHALLEKHLVAPGLLAAEELTRLSRLEERRSVADYRAAEQIEEEQARALVADARAFLEAARRVLGSLPG
jgi:uncharacterized protein (UPF0332 family)